jgi:predicted flap endonuclease-1-like 5' DNA nuclease
MEFVSEYWFLILVAIAVIAILAFILLRPRQRVQLSKDEAPTRPHMQHASGKEQTRRDGLARGDQQRHDGLARSDQKRPGDQEADHEGRDIASAAAAAVSDVSGEFINAPVHANLPGASGPPDDLTRLKGVGPKLAALLNQFGISRFDQLATLSGADLERLDQRLGPFKGRLARDQVPLQAEYLARGDVDGFEQRFGKL